MRKKEEKGKFKKGSILVFTLFLMMITLIIGVGIMSTSSIGRQSSLSTTKSVHSFQVADSGMEYALMKIKSYYFAVPPYQLISPATIEQIFGSSDCDAGTGAIKVFFDDASCELYFYDSSDNNIDCDSTTTFADIVKIKAVGTHNNITRSIEMDSLNFP